MTWLRRTGYYYRSEREGDTVRSVYVGPDPRAQIFLVLEDECRFEAAMEATASCLMTYRIVRARRRCPKLSGVPLRCSILCQQRRKKAGNFTFRGRMGNISKSVFSNPARPVSLEK